MQNPRTSSRAEVPRRAASRNRGVSDEPVVIEAHGLPGMAILPLRLFLGLTFLYAGLQKLTDPGFFSPGAGTYIGNQILSYSRGSPIQLLLHPAMQFAGLVGALTIGMEMGIGLLVLLGLFTRPAALVGLFLNLVFFLSASWHTYPYFMGSDIVFVMCWLTLALTGPGPFSLDPSLRRPLGHRLESNFGAEFGGAYLRPQDRRSGHRRSHLRLAVLCLRRRLYTCRMYRGVRSTESDAGLSVSWSNVRPHS